jgi:DNA-binding HxlR family transcriptional regulator
MTNSATETPPRKSYNHPCLIARALDVLGDRWTLLILRDLMSGLQRYSDILDNCDGLSPNLLSTRLKRLEADGLVERHYFKGLPPRVEYTLTEKGWAVRPVLLSLIEWSQEWTDMATDTAGFFRFIRCEAAPEECGELTGDPAAAVAIQSCFQGR